MTKMLLKYVCAIAFSLGGLVSMGQPVKSVIGAQKTLYMNGASAKDYIQDGLFFLGENIAPPSSGMQIVSIGDLPIVNGWTVEICGIYTMSQSGEPVIFSVNDTSSIRIFGIGWRVNANHTAINIRWFVSEADTGQTVGSPAQLAYTMNPNKTLVGYAQGLPFLNVSATSAQLPDTTITKLVSAEGGAFNIYSLRVYDRPLSAEEIAHNYAIDKERFGLP